MVLLSGVKNTVLLWVLIVSACGNPTKKNDSKIVLDSVAVVPKTPKPVLVAANRTAEYLRLLRGKKVGVVANQTTVIFKTEDTYIHLVDSLLSSQVAIKKVFAPEHGFRGRPTQAKR